MILLLSLLLREEVLIILIFLIILFCIFFALNPNLNVDNVSFAFVVDGDTFIISETFDAPPKESCNNRVSLLFLYGICEVVLTHFVVNDEITNPSEDNDLFIIFASFNCFPSKKDFPANSLPAKSTKTNFPVIIFNSVLFVSYNLFF